MNLLGGTLHKLENSLDYATMKNQTLSDNIANVDTPNYKAKDVDFRDILADELNGSVRAKRTHPKHMPSDNTLHNTPRVFDQNNTNYNHNGNNVDIDKEMTNLAKNQLYYQSIVDQMNDKFHNLQTVIRGGS